MECEPDIYPAPIAIRPEFIDQAMRAIDHEHHIRNMLMFDKTFLPPNKKRPWRIAKAWIEFI